VFAGNSKDIRGYAVAKYQDRRMIVGQVEYRRELFWRLGAVAYFGAGEAADKFSDFNTDSILPGGGIGLRLTLAEQDHINLRIDYAWGQNSTAFYVGIMEVF
jgi:outer membrane translocation and assembly module TamA